MSTINHRKHQNIFKYLDWASPEQTAENAVQLTSTSAFAQPTLTLISIKSTDSNIIVCVVSPILTPPDLNICNSNNTIIICFTFTYNNPPKWQIIPSSSVSPLLIITQNDNKAKRHKSTEKYKILFPDFYNPTSKNGCICKICSSLATEKGDWWFVKRPGSIGDHPAHHMIELASSKRL